MKDIAAFSLGKMDQWGLVNDFMTYDPWDFAHITAFNFLPFLLARIGKAAGWVVRLVHGSLGGGFGRFDFAAGLHLQGIEPTPRMRLN